MFLYSHCNRIEPLAVNASIIAIIQDVECKGFVAVLHAEICEEMFQGPQDTTFCRAVWSDGKMSVVIVLGYITSNGILESIVFRVL